MKANKLSTGSNLRWEGSRMMLPEHVGALRSRKIDQKKVEKPDLDEQQWEEIERTLCEAMGKTLPLEITYFKNGLSERFIGFAIQFDSYTKRLKVEDPEGEPEWLPFLAILELKLSDENIQPHCEDF